MYEFTVYSGVTEEEYLLVVEEVSGLKFNEVFFAGYSLLTHKPRWQASYGGKNKKVIFGSTTVVADIVEMSTILCLSKELTWLLLSKRLKQQKI